MVKFYSDEDLARLRRDGVAIDLPAWSFGGHPEAIAPFAGWDLQPLSEGWGARNAESVDGMEPGLLKVIRVGTSIDPSDVDGYHRLSELSAHDAMYKRRDWDSAQQLHHYLASAFPGDLTAMMMSFRTLVISAARAADLPEIAAAVLGGWLPPMGISDASLHLVKQSKAFGNRYGLPRALLQRDRPTESDRAFGSTMALVDEAMFGLASYLEPLMTSLSPRVWGVTAPRVGGVLVLNFGQLLPGRRDVATDLITLSARSAELDDLVDDAVIPAEAFRDTVNWWTNRLDLVFSHLTEPSNYEVDGRYNAPSALERIVNFEQICRSCQVIATVDDEHARRLAMFHVLDSMRGIRRDFDMRKLTNLPENRKLLENLTDAMPPNVQLVLLPRAVAAVGALEQVQDGFIPSPKLTATGLLRPDGNGVEAEAPLATAASEWLKIIRDSQHGYDKTPTAQARALLAAHTGHVPPRLPELAWLNLLRILAFPETLKRHRR